jgi:hypothetical protein
MRGPRFLLVGKTIKSLESRKDRPTGDAERQREGTDRS